MSKSSYPNLALSHQNFCICVKLSGKVMGQPPKNTVIVLLDEKRIIYQKSKLKVIGDERCLNIDESKIESDDVIANVVRDAIEYLISNVAALSDHSEQLCKEFKSNESRLIALNRLKVVKFDSCSTIGGLTSILEPNKQSVARSIKRISAKSILPKDIPHAKAAASIHLPNKKVKSAPTTCSKKLPKQPKYFSGDMHDLEPGEVPNPNYVPPPPASVRPVYCSVYPCEQSLLNVPFCLFNYATYPDGDGFEPEKSSIDLENCRNFPWISSKSIQPTKTLSELYRIAKESARETSGEPSSLPSTSAESIFPSFPTTCESDTKKLYKKSRKKLGRQYRVKFTNDVAMLRHHSNRWVKGGRLSTTGEFVEGNGDSGLDSDSSSDQDDSTPIGPRLPKRTNRRAPSINHDATSNHARKNSTNVDEEPRALPADWLNMDVDAVDRPVGADDVAGGRIDDVIAHQLANPVAPPPKRKIKTEFIYEDTLQYAEYAKYYAQLHGVNHPGSSDDPMQAWQRQWFQYYRSAVQFVDVPAEDGCTVDRKENDVANQPDSSYRNLSARDRLELFYQQWRWKQVQLYNDYCIKYYRDQSKGDGNARSNPVANTRELSVSVPKSWTNDVSCGSEPVVYKTEEFL